MEEKRALLMTDAAPGPDPFVSRVEWEEMRPSTLVIACSDGRLQAHTDEFLQRGLGISHYDRVFAPGGPGALATGAGNFGRGDAFRRECAFLIAAHGIRDVFLVYHGPAADGPPDATCGDYRRRLPFATPAQIRTQQENDAAELLRNGIAIGAPVRLHPYRCEVTADGRVRFVPLA
jgi:hypothetical protein